MGHSPGAGRVLLPTRRITVPAGTVLAGARTTIGSGTMGFENAVGSWGPDATVIACPLGGIETGLVIASTYAVANVLFAELLNTTGGDIPFAERDWIWSLVLFNSGL